MKIREVVLGPVTPLSLLVVVLVVCSLTSINIYLNPPPPETEQEAPEVWFYIYIENLSWSNYTKYDIDCWVPAGMTLEEFVVEGGYNTYEEGALHGFGDPNVSTGEFYLMWKPYDSFNDWKSALEYATGLVGIDVQCNETALMYEIPSRYSWQDHNYVMSLLNGTGAYSDEFIGVFEALKCDKTNRTFIFLYINFKEFKYYDYKYNGAVYGATYRCHPYEGTPLDLIIGYPYKPD
ncbi:MAG TPA: hypothetical protein VGB32_04385 [Candidatus Bathyarchaeia archaeon]